MIAYVINTRKELAEKLPDIFKKSFSENLPVKPIVPSSSLTSFIRNEVLNYLIKSNSSQFCASIIVKTYLDLAEEISLGQLIGSNKLPFHPVYAYLRLKQSLFEDEKYSDLKNLFLEPATSFNSNGANAVAIYKNLIHITRKYLSYRKLLGAKPDLPPLTLTEKKLIPLFKQCHELLGRQFFDAIDSAQMATQEIKKGTANILRDSALYVFVYPVFVNPSLQGFFNALLEKLNIKARGKQEEDYSSAYVDSTKSKPDIFSFTCTSFHLQAITAVSLIKKLLNEFSINPEEIAIASANSEVRLKLASYLKTYGICTNDLSGTPLEYCEPTKVVINFLSFNDENWTEALRALILTARIPTKAGSREFLSNAHLRYLRLLKEKRISFDEFLENDSNHFSNYGSLQESSDIFSAHEHLKNLATFFRELNNASSVDDFASLAISLLRYIYEKNAEPASNTYLQVKELLAILETISASSEYILDKVDKNEFVHLFNLLISGTPAPQVNNPSAINIGSISDLISWQPKYLFILDLDEHYLQRLAYSDRELLRVQPSTKFSSLSQTEFDFLQFCALFENAKLIFSFQSSNLIGQNETGQISPWVKTLCAHLTIEPKQMTIASEFEILNKLTSIISTIEPDLSNLFNKEISCRNKEIKELGFANQAELIKNKYEPELSPFKGKLSKSTNCLSLPSPISFELIKTYLECPRRFFFKYLLNLVDKDPMATDNDSSANGQLIHSYAQTHLPELAKQIASSNDLQDIFNRVVSEIDSFLNKQLPSDLNNSGIHLNSFARARERQLLTVALTFFSLKEIKRLKKSKPIETEHEKRITKTVGYHLENGEQFSVELSGRIDRVEKSDDNSFVIFDIKSSLSLQGQTDKHSDRLNDLQLKIYALLLGNTEEGTSQDISVATIKVTPRLKDLDRYPKPAKADGNLQIAIVKFIQEFIELAKNGYFIPTPSLRKTFGVEMCRYCSYRNVCSPDKNLIWGLAEENEEIKKLIRLRELKND